METIFRKLPKDILLKIALKLDFPDILNLCKSDEKINEKLCKSENNWVWIEKLQKDFNVNYNNIKTIEIPKTLYFNLNEDFNNVLQNIFNEGYPNKLKDHLIKSGYIKEFQNEIIKVLGPRYGEKINIKLYDELNKDGGEILETYFFDAGHEKGYYPLRDTLCEFLDTFQIIYYE